MHRTDSTSVELPEYMAAIETHQAHSVVSKWFYQITVCRLLFPGQGVASFLMIEFRDGNVGAMVWNDGQGNWGTGGWRELSADGRLTIDIDYMRNVPAARSFAEVLDMVAVRRAEIKVQPRETRRWWQFW